MGSSKEIVFDIFPPFHLFFSAWIWVWLHGFCSILFCFVLLLFSLGEDRGLASWCYGYTLNSMVGFFLIGSNELDRMGIRQRIRDTKIYGCGWS